MDVANIEVDVDEGDNKYQRRKNASGFLGKLIKAHEVHPKYAVSIEYKSTILNKILKTFQGGNRCDPKNFIYAVIDNIGRFYDITYVNQGMTPSIPTTDSRFIF